MKNALLFGLMALIPVLAMQSQPTVDYRIYQSPVKNQVDRGTCTAFAVLAAMETFPGFPSDLSEQYVYAWVKMEHYKELTEYQEGALLQFYIDVLQQHGTLREDQETYNPNSIIWDTTVSSFEMMKQDLGGSRIYDLLTLNRFAYKLQPEMYTYLAGEQAADINYIKMRLANGLHAIPATYRVNSYYWYLHQGQPDAKMDPSDFWVVVEGDEEYTYDEARALYGSDGLISKLRAGELDAYYTSEDWVISEGHAVAICGYDDSGFLIKNSWGTDWGDEGYGWISYDYHKLFVNEVMTLSLGKVYVWDNPEREDQVRPEEVRLKSLPVETKAGVFQGASKGISLSVVYYGDSYIPRFTDIKYDLYDPSGRLKNTYYGNTHGIFDGRETGYATYVLLEEGDTFPSIDRVVATFKTDRGETFTNTYYNISAINKIYPPAKD